MSQRVVDQACEVITRYLGYELNTDATATAINLLSEYLKKDYPGKAEAAIGEGLQIARDEALRKVQERRGGQSG